MAGIIFNIEESIHNSKFNVLQEPIKMILENEVEAFEQSSIIPKVFVMKTSDRYREEYRSSTTMDGFKPTEDMEPAGLSDFEDGYSKQFIFQTWTNAFIISKQTIEDGELSNIDPKALGFIKSYGRTRELYAVNMLGAAVAYPDMTTEQKEALKENYRITAYSGLGMDTTDGTIEGTKVQYFHNEHKPKGYKAEAGHQRNFTQSNKFNANLAWDGTDPELEEKVMDILGQVDSIMSTYKDDKGNIVPVMATKIVIGKDYRLQDVLERALKSKYGTRMGANGINTSYGMYEIEVSPYLSSVQGFTNEDKGVLLISPDRNREGMGAVWFDRVPLQVDSYVDKKTKANIWDGRARFGAGFGDFRAMSYISLAGKQTTNSTTLNALATSVKAVKVVNTDEQPVKTKEVQN